MKIFIVTFSKYENYGSRLQNYALCSVLKKLRVEPVTLVVNSTKEKVIWLIKSCLSALPIFCFKQRIWINEKIKKQKFKEFNKSLNLFHISYQNLKELDFDKSIAIAGSDQIWSPAHIKKKPEDLEVFFLRFLPKSKRFAYAPSFGVNSIPIEMCEIYKKYILDFQKLSVREISGQEIINRMIGIKVPVLVDPTFLLDKEEWLDFINNNKIQNKQKKKYILKYFLSEQENKTLKKIENYANKNNFEIIDIAGNIYENDKIVPSPDSFVNLINNAELVFTDSFHGCVFSIIMQTKFIVFRRTDVEQFSRIETLLKKFKISGVLADENTNFRDFNKNFTEKNFELSKELIKIERQNGINYLKEIIKSTKESGIYV